MRVRVDQTRQQPQTVRSGIRSGAQPFSVNDEWYYHMRFVPDMKGVTPVLSALPDEKTITGRPAGPPISW